MGIEVPELVVVLLCIIGAGALVTVFAAFGKSIFSKDEPERDPHQRSPEQDSYQRRVREINQLAIWGQARLHRKEQRRQREREASDIEIQSGLSHSNAGRHGGSEYSQRNRGYYNHGYSHHAPPVAYYEEEEFAEYVGSDVGSGERPLSQSQQQVQYPGGYTYQYVTTQPKSHPTETWNEVPR